MTSERRKKVRSLFSFCSFHFLDDGFTDSIYLLLPFIAAELSLNFSQVGLLKGIFSGSMGLFQVPLSFLGERIGELTVIAAGTFGLAGGFLLLSRVHTFLAILISLILAKATGGGQHGLSSSLLSRVFEISGRRAAMGTYNFSGDLGKVCLPFLLALMINLWGWRQAVLILSFFGFVAGAILWTIAREKGSDSPISSPSERVPAKKGDWGIRDSKSFSSLLTIGIIDITTRTALLTFLPFLLLRKGIPMAQVGFCSYASFCRRCSGKICLWDSGGVVWNHPHGGGDRNPDLRWHSFLNLVPIFIDLVYSSPCGNRLKRNLFCSLCHGGRDDRSECPFAGIWPLLCDHSGLRRHFSNRLWSVHRLFWPPFYPHCHRFDRFIDSSPHSIPLSTKGPFMLGLLQESF